MAIETIDIDAAVQPEDTPVEDPGTLSSVSIEAMDGDIVFYDTDDVSTVTPSTPKLLVIGRWCIPESQGGNPIEAAKAFTHGLSYVADGDSKLHVEIT